MIGIHVNILVNVTFPAKLANVQVNPKKKGGMLVCLIVKCGWNFYDTSFGLIAVGYL